MLDGLWAVLFLCGIFNWFCNDLIVQSGFLIQVDVRVMSPVASGRIEREERQEQEHQEKDETEREIPMEQEREKERDRMDLSKLPLQWTSKGVKPESRPEKSEKACQFFQLNFFSMRSKVCFQICN
jgi:hypothetical protein